MRTERDLRRLMKVRAEEGEQTIGSLEYEAYVPMAEKQLRDLGERMAREFGLVRLAVWHSRGRVEVGGVSFRLVIESRHRREALTAMDRFIDELKRDVAIWKRVGDEEV